MKKTILFICIICFYLAGSAQTEVEVPVVRKNIVSAQLYGFFPAIGYERIIRFNDKSGVIPGVGAGLYDVSIIPIFTSSLYYGSIKHRWEFGATLIALELPLIHVTYRYIHKKGFTLRAGFGYMPGEEGAPMLGIGYAF